MEPAAVLGARLGEAIVARNIGGRVTPAVIKDLALIVHLHENKTPNADWFEIAVIHHTECGSGLLADDDLRGGWDEQTSLKMAVLEPSKTVQKDIAKLRSAPELAPAISDIKIGGYAYDLGTGKITTVVQPG
ncbi:carbonic anhydrase [Streptomyces sp. NPDC097727]|uniref:carbonic anhydrase n=1 Tax=Streptomyces sp. NPDC097727 TaxID=3366092 RepID=UPI00381AFB7B